MVNQAQPISHRSDPNAELLELHSILDNIDRGFMSVDRNWSIIYINKRAADNVGRKSGELIGKNLWFEFPQLEGTDTAKLFRKAMDERVAVEIEEFGVIADNWYHEKAYPTSNGIAMAWADITAHKKAEEGLRESEEHFSKAFRNNPAAMAISNIDGQIVDVNESFERLMGYARDEVIGKIGCDIGLYSPSEREELIKQLNKKGKVSNLEMVFQQKSGNQVNVLFSLEQITLNKKPYSLGIAIDNTESKKVEKALKESEERFRALVESTSDMIWQVDENAVYTYVSPKVKDILGYEPEEVVGKTPFELIEDNKEKIVDAFLEIMNKKEPFYGLETWNVHKNGSCVLLETSGVPILDEKGQLLGYRGIDRDITERKKAEDTLKLNNAITNSIINSTNDGIYAIDSNWNFLYVNKNVANLVNCTPEKMVGKNGWLFFPRILGTMVEKNFRKVMETKKSIIFEYRGVYSDNYWEYNVYPTEDGLVVYAKNITERKKSEKILESYTKNLEGIIEKRTKQLKGAERLAAIGQTAGMVGHDIRNPLQAITGDVYLLKDYLINMPDDNSTKAEVLESLDSIEKNISYINKIVADLQDYARPVKSELSEFNLYELITTVFAPIEIPSDITVLLDIDSAYKLKSDPTLLRRIMSNLIVNALQAMPDGGKLCVSGYQSSERFLIIVEDTGVGIPENVKPKLFTPMMTTKSKGQGLGLAVVKRLVEALNGTIGFESEEGEVTRFFVELPLDRKG